MNAQWQWKKNYLLMKEFGADDMAQKLRRHLKQIRREAALERALESSQREVEAIQEIMRAAIHIGLNYGGNDGAHHKQWTIDQMIRILAGDEYDRLVVESCAGEDGPNTYEWDTGIAP